MGPAGGQPKQKRQQFFLQRHFVLDGEVFVESHPPVGHEDQHGGTEPHRAGGHHGNPHLACAVEDPAPDVESKKIDAVDDDVRPLEKRGHIVLVDAFRKEGQVQKGIDLLRLRHHGLELGLTEVVDFGTVLAVHIGRFEMIEFGQSKTAEPHAGQGDEVNTPDAAQSGDGHPGIEQTLLLGHRDKPSIALQGDFQIMEPVLESQRMNPCAQIGRRRRRRGHGIPTWRSRLW